MGRKERAWRREEAGRYGSKGKRVAEEGEVSLWVGRKEGGGGWRSKVMGGKKRGWWRREVMGGKERGRRRREK